ncbi:hypothetical protein ES703_121969 [subsurface metagenome]
MSPYIEGKSEGMKRRLLIISLALAAIALLGIWGCKSLPPDDGENQGIAPSEEESQEIAIEYLLNCPTFKFDGIEDSVRLVATNTLRGPNSWEFIYEFECLHAGYGNRSGQYVAEVITPHTARIIVVRGEVTSAIMDEKWDMMKQMMLSGDTDGFPHEPQEAVKP